MFSFRIGRINTHGKPSPGVILFLLAVVSGILFDTFLTISMKWLIVCAIVFLPLTVASLFIPNDKPLATRLLRPAMVFVFVLFCSAIQHQSFIIRRTQLIDNEEHIYKANVLTVSNEASDYLKLRVKTTHYLADEEWTSFDGRVFELRIPNDSNSCSLLCGDELMFSAKIQAPHNHHDAFRFDYDKYLINHAVAGVTFLSSDSWQRSEGKPRFPLRRMAQRARNYCYNRYCCWNLPDDDLALLSALTLGKRDLITADLRNSYSSAGAAHVLAVSGLHVGIIYFLLLTLFQLVTLKRFNTKKLDYVILPLIWFYAFVAGLSPSVIRTCIMLTIYRMMSNAGESSEHSLSVVFFTAIINLLITPVALWDAGFQLSYSAVVSLLLVMPLINDLLIIKPRWLNWLVSLFIVSCVAQFGTAPFIAHYFHNLPLFFWLSGYWVIILAYLILALTLLCFLPIPFLNHGIVFLLKQLLSMMNGGVVQIAMFKGASLFTWTNEWQALLWAVAAYSIMWAFYSRRKWLIPTALILACIATIPSIKRNYNNRIFNETRLYLTGKGVMLNVIDNRCNRNTAYCIGKINPHQTALNYWNYRNSREADIYFPSDDTAYFHLNMPNGETVCFVSCNVWQLPDNESYDWIILSCDSKLNLDNMIQKIHCSHLVVEKLYSQPWKQRIVESFAEQTNTDVVSCSDFFGESIVIK